MKKNILIILLSVASITCPAITKSEFQDYVGEQMNFYSAAGYIELYKNGTGIYTSDIMASLGGMYDFGFMIGLGSVPISCDGVTAKCRYRCIIALKWQVSNGKVVLKYTNVKGNTTAEIAEWEGGQYPASSTVECVKRKLRKQLAEDKALIGKSDTFIVIEENGKIGLRGASWNEVEAALGTFWGAGGDSGSSSQTSYTPKEPVVVKASYPDGDYGIKNYISDKLTYPNHIRKNGYSKSASYTLSISSDGSVKDAWTTDDIDSKLANETIRLLKNLPKRFTPETSDGQKVGSDYSITISYYVDPALDFDAKSINFTYKGGEKRIKVSSSQNWKIVPRESSKFTFRKEGKYIVVSCGERNKFDYNGIFEKLIVSTSDDAISYEIKVSQEGAPKPYIRPSQTTVNLPRKKKDARAVVIVNSNRDWKIVNHNPESNINVNKSDERVIFTTKKNGRKEGEDATITLESLDNDCQTNILVHQYSRKEEKLQGGSSSKSGLGLWYNYYDNYGSFELGLLSVQAGFGCTLPLFANQAGQKTFVGEAYFPMNFELGTLRFHFVELSLLNLRLDLTLDGLDGIAWEPQVRALFPVSDRWALMPYVGPVWQIDTQQMENSVWSASGGLIARVRYGHATHTDLSIGYRGGPLGGIAIGVSIGWSLGW
ncbi:MAG: energy transducer TonB [Paludibacteraceae bacterium]|nr:energy transducer TonB [Paludibacteraceae bacterium]